ncbi:HlyD family efflux transporter periplasmic adaptor subunit [Empedobacter falsenii]
MLLQLWQALDLVKIKLSSIISFRRMKIKLFVTIVLFVTLQSCGSKEEAQPVVKDIKELVFASGILDWDDAYHLTAQTDGILTEANFEVGDKVNTGKVIAVIDNPSNRINTHSAEEQLTIANENLTENSPAIQQLEQNIRYAESKYEQDKQQAERYERLFQKQSVAKVEFENMQLATKNSLAQLNALKKQKAELLQRAKTQQISNKNQLQNSKVIERYNQLIIPQNGTIVNKLKSTGDYVRKGDIVATIADDSKPEVVLNVDEKSIGKIKLGQLVYIQFNTDKSNVYEGKISEIVAAFDEKTQSFVVKVLLNEAPSSSIYGTQLEANILTSEKKNALLIPRSYLGFGNKVKLKGKDEPVVVKTGIISTEYVEILEGISKDDILEHIKL